MSKRHEKDLQSDIEKDSRDIAGMKTSKLADEIEREKGEIANLQERVERAVSKSEKMTGKTRPSPKDKQ